LQSWADQGVLLLNSVLTVESGQPGSHAGKGWEIFTDKVISVVDALERPLVFVLWGAYAQKKGAMIDSSRHLVIRSPHPSPLSAHRGFFGSRPFSKINDYLKRNGQHEIDWST
jgi:uracil-DNA glycosylase